MVLHNPNNWHWVNKDVSAWAKDYLGEKLAAISAEENGVTAKVSKIVSMDGDVDVSQRKGKVITLFDVKLTLEFEGTTDEDDSVSGSIKIPEVAHDTEEDEYVFDISLYSESASKQPVKDLVRSKIVPQLRTELAKLAPALIAEHGKDIQHAPGSNPSSGFATPKYLSSDVQSSSKPATQTTTTTTRKQAVNTVTVNASDEFRTTAEEMYTTFTDPQRLAVFTRAPPRRFDGAQVGGKFSIFDGNVTGDICLQVALLGLALYSDPIWLFHEKSMSGNRHLELPTGNITLVDWPCRPSNPFAFVSAFRRSRAPNQRSSVAVLRIRDLDLCILCGFCVFLATALDSDSSPATSSWRSPAAPFVGILPRHTIGILLQSYP
ncbi:Aha1p [Coccidioides immitis H538.4]|uniref:Aha1p n=1 Tax=Coccidioides immitis H538.4 TaxID=396776 RepID=A0A0J8RXQ0_COCIT|nr:Aha1p [Coccidioides immitis H538.4]